MFFASLLFGIEGNYRGLGLDVNFEEKFYNQYDFYTSRSCFPVKAVGYVCENLLKSRTLKILTFAYLHVFIHEMGHVLAKKILNLDLGSSEYINIFTNQGMGNCSAGYEYGIKNTFINVAGPAANLLFSSCICVASAAFKSYIGWPVYLLLVGGAVSWMAGELTYAAFSAIREDRGDFGQIASQGTSHLIVSSIVVISICALGILGIAYI